MTSPAENGIAIIAGDGELPRILAEHQRSSGLNYLIVAFEGQSPPWIEEHPHHIGQFEKAVPLFDALKQANCERVIFAGSMKRPSLNPLKFDKKFLKLATYLLPALKGGDDATLRAVSRVFEEENIKVVGIDEIMQELIAKKGPATKVEPTQSEFDDMQRAFDILAAISDADIGQGCVVSNGICLAVETIGGTDLMLESLHNLPVELRGKTPNGILCKAPKKSQDKRFDLPTIGVQTIENAHAAGLKGVCVPEGGSIVIAPDKVVKRADELGLFVHIAGQSK